MNIDLTGRLAFVTGGARGIGEAVARSFVAAGARVVIADRNIKSALAVGSILGAPAVELDIAAEPMVHEVIAACERDHGAIDVLVNCAGVLQNPEPPECLSMQTWDRIVDIHLRGTYLVCADVGGRMAKRRAGNIVNIASVAGLQSAPLHAYAPAKAAIISLTQCLAAEWGRAGVRVNSVAPGFVATPALQRGVELGLMDLKRLADASALGRIVDPEEIAAGVLFLASDWASAISGVTLPIDAGFLAASAWGPFGGPRARPPTD